MPDTMYASTPDAPAVELSCPVVTDDDVRRALQGFTSADEFVSTPLQSRDWLGSNDGGVFRSSSGSSNDRADPFAHGASSPMFVTSTGASSKTHLVPLFPAASDAALQGFVRVINHSGDAGEVQVDAIDDTGTSYGPLTLSIDGHQTVHFNSDDLEAGNAGKGLTGSTGVGEGDWRLTLSSDLDLEVLSYIRTTDGFLTAMHDLAPEAEGVHRIAIFNPGSNTSQVSRLRLLNTGETEAQVTIAGTDDRGMSPGDAVEVTVAAGASRTLTAAELESGGTGMTGALGDGAGKWRLAITSDQPIHALSLLSSPTGHLTNLSTAPSNEVDGVHEVALFPSASDASGRQGFVRVINPGEETAEITITAHDETDWAYDPLTLPLAGGHVAHFNSNDLEQGNAGKGLTGSTGAGEGDWRLALSSDADIEVLAYIRTTDGFLTAMHDVAPVSDRRHCVPIFNPGSNTSQVSRLRLANGGDTAAEVTIAGVDDRGLSPGADIQLTLPAGATQTYTAQELESGAERFTGALGDGTGKWRLEVTADQPIRVLSLLSSPTGHLTNLSTASGRDPAAAMRATAEEVFGTLISPIVQSQCVNCHVEGGVSGNTRLVFVTDDDADHVTTNLSAFETFLSEVEDGAELILNKVQGVGHGGGIQLAAGTDEFSDMEQFLGLLGGEEVGPVAVTPANLFDGVKMESWRSTLRRAAIVFAGRTPTEEEYASIRGASVAEFRAAIRGLMQGPEFHEFLVRASNDRLLTDRDLSGAIIPTNAGFVAYTNLAHEQSARGVSSGDLYQWERLFQYGFGRAPLELIAHVAERDLPYTEVLTADYIMANPFAARGYGASSTFDDLSDVHEFRPSEIVSYYRKDESKRVEETEFGTRVLEPGNLATDYPHAGVLNTTVFLLRYPTTATNRNRARSRWTYYHFLGLDIEKSASRTTDPVALADTNNPTMRNSACTVCHTVMDPVAGAFQNYGDEGLYRDQWGGLDALDGHYKEGAGDLHTLEVNGDTYESRQTFSRLVWLDPGSSLALRHYNNNGCGDDGEQTCGRDLRIDGLLVRDMDGGIVDRIEWSELDESCEYDGAYNAGSGGDDDHYQWWGWECHEIPVEVAESTSYMLEITLWADQSGDETTSFKLGARLYQEGDTWYRDMRKPGFGGESVPNADYSLPWLAERIVADPRFAEATVRFWWPAVMGREVAEAPEDQSDSDFEGRLLASNAQAAETARLARGFRRGFRGGSPYNLKDLLVEIVLSRWFRAQTVSDDDGVPATALLGAGARRLLTAEELARKTLALTGFQWGREHIDTLSWRSPERDRWSALSDTVGGYGLLYGGIDSDGITKRGRDLTSVMAGVAQRHASAVACPVVMKEIYLLPEEDRRLLGGVDPLVTPAYEFGSVFEIGAPSRDEIETVSLEGPLSAGSATVKLAFLNDFWDEPRGDRDVLLDRLTLLRGGNVVYRYEIENLDHKPQCHHLEQGAFHLSGSGPGCRLSIPIDIPEDGTYRIEVDAWGDQHGDELPRLEVAVETDTVRSAGANAIKAKLAELHDRLLGVRVEESSEDVQAAFDLFVDVWRHGRDSVEGDFRSLRCEYGSDGQFFDGILDDIWVTNEDGNPDWDWDRINAHLNTVDWSDHHVARTWVVMLAYLMTDPRYLHL